MVRLITFSQVYSFVPIPGAQQHKRPRRRYEEIERMYKCGWNGCEKAYGTLNHLNAHVTMQSHGAKRTPEGELIDPRFHPSKRRRGYVKRMRVQTSSIDDCWFQGFLWNSDGFALSYPIEYPFSGRIRVIPFSLSSSNI